MRRSDGRWLSLLREFGASRSLVLLEPDPVLGEQGLNQKVWVLPLDPGGALDKAQLVPSRLQVSCLRSSLVWLCILWAMRGTTSSCFLINKALPNLRQLAVLSRSEQILPSDPQATPKHRDTSLRLGRRLAKNSIKLCSSSRFSHTYASLTKEKTDISFLFPSGWYGKSLKLWVSLKLLRCGCQCHPSGTPPLWPIHSHCSCEYLKIRSSERWWSVCTKAF